MRLSKKKWLLMQGAALMLIVGGIFLVRPYLVKAAPVSTSSMSGLGLPGMPFEITNCQELQDVQMQLSATYRLVNDIDCSDTINWNSGAGFIPIGLSDNGTMFNGHLDGKGHTISGLYINQDGSSSGNGYAGLFAETGNFTNVINLKITGATIIGNSDSGNLAAATGGVIGKMNGGLIDRLHFSGSISVPDCNTAHQIGGIVGQSEAQSGSWNRFIGLSSEGTITVTGTSCGEFTVTAGGLIGQNEGYDLADTYSTIDITLSGQTTAACQFNCRYVGGLIGTMGTDGNGNGAGIEKSYYAGTITITSSVTPYLEYAAGGIVGYQEGTSNINRSFSAVEFDVPADCDDNDCGPDDRHIGAITGDDNGATAGGAGNWFDLYYDQTLAGTTYCADGSTDANWRCNAVNTDGLDPDYFKGLTPNEPIYTHFDYSAPIWELTSGYPVLADDTAQYPAAPTDLQTTIDSSTSITLSWTDNVSVGYHVLCRPANGLWANCANYTDQPTATIANLQPGTQYEFKVVANQNTYLGSPSQSVFATTATPGFTLISDCQQLQDMRNDLNGYYELGRDIDCSDSITWNNGAGFIPIGEFDPFVTSTFNTFGGLFKGNNYSIKNLYIDQTIPSPNNLTAALFAGPSGGIIQDFTLDSPIISGGVITASIAGFVQNSTISNVHVTNATMSSANAYGMAGFVGGISEHTNKTTVTRSSFEGSIHYTGSTPAGYVAGFVSNLTTGISGAEIDITNSYANANIIADNGATMTGGFAGFTDSNVAGASINISNSYSAGSMSIQGTYQAPQPPTPDFGFWVAGGFAAAVVAPESGNTTFTNNFASVAVSKSGLQQGTSGFIGLGYVLVSLPDSNYPNDLSSNYFDADQAGTLDCVANLTGNCTGISGLPNYFKNNSSNPPLNTWDFTNIWSVNSEFPLFSTAVTSGLTTIPPERLPAPTTPGGSTGGGTTEPTVSAAADDNSTVRVGSGLFANTTTIAVEEAGVLGAIKNFVRSLPASVVVAFPYALFGLLLLAALILFIELIRELRRLRSLQALISKQRLLAEERDAFWHLAANYLRAPVTLIVGGAEALRESHVEESTTAIATLAASLQNKVAQIMAKIEQSTSLQAISQAHPQKATQIARRAVFIVPVAVVALLTILGNYAASSYRDLGPSTLGYAMQLVGFIIAVVLFYWVLGLLTQGKSKRKAAEELLDRQTKELATARHQLIEETASSLNPDLTKLEGMLHALPAAMSTTAGGALTTLGEGTSRLRQIVSSFAMLIKVQEGTGGVTPTPATSTIDLTNLLSRTRAKLTPQIAAKGVRVMAPAVPLTVTAEADLANQVLESIISNAVDYSPTNGTVKVEARRLQDAIELRVSDQGQGINKSQLDHLFQPFVRADGKSAMDMSHGGFGINLYLDKLIMEQLGGSISATSTEGKGTAITMTWPT